MTVKNRPPEAPSTDTPVSRLAASRARMKAFLQDAENAEQARAAMADEEAATNEVVARARAGEFAEQAFVEGYGEEFVRELKSHHGG